MADASTAPIDRAGSKPEVLADLERQDRARLRAGFFRAYFATLGGMVAVIPVVAAVATVAIYLAQVRILTNLGVVVVGLGVAVLLCLVAAVFGTDKATASGAHGRAYVELSLRMRQLDYRLQTVSRKRRQKPEYAEAHAALESTEQELFDTPPGPKWSSAVGYVSVWRAVHRTEEALIGIDEPEGVIAGALVDDLRLDGSTIPGRDRLVEFLHTGVVEIDPDAARIYLGVRLPQGAPRERLPVQEYRARATLREVRRAINDFRDSRMEDLVRTRNIYRKTFGFAAIVSYALLVVAVLSGISLNVIASATGLFLIAALVGLFARLRSSKVAQSTVDDFGLYESQLLAGPLASGIAGLGGVILIAAAPIAAAALSATGASQATAQPLLNFEAILNVGANPLSVIFAALFGFAPDLLLNRLQAETDRLKSEIRSSYVADKSAAGPPKPAA